MRKLKIVLALVASIAMIVVGQRHHVSQKDARTHRAEVQGLDAENQGLDAENEALFI